MNAMMGNSQFFALPERKQTIVDAGIPLFEIRKTKFFDNTQRDFGPWDVRAWDQLNETTMKSSYRVSWYQGENAYIEYFPNKKGIATAFVPDDDVWHNRIWMAGTIAEGNYSIFRLHTKEGSLPAAVALQYVTVVRAYIFEWKVLKAGKCVFKSKKKAECDSFMATTEGCTVTLGKLDEFEDMIRRLGGNWMLDPAFQANHKPRIQALIDEAVGKANVATVGQTLVAQISTLSEDDRKKIAAMLLGEKAGVSELPPAALPLNTPATPVVPNAAIPRASAVSTPETSIDDLPLAQLCRIAKDRGLTIKQGMKKPGVIALIKEKIAMDRKAADEAAKAELADDLPGVPAKSLGGDNELGDGDHAEVVEVQSEE